MTILPVVIFDDIEAWTVGKLDAALAARDESYAQDVTVATEVPEERTARMVIVRRDGGGRGVVLEQPRLGVRVFAESEIEAGDLARLASALLWASPDGHPVSKVTITGGPYRVADPSTAALYYFTAELVSKGRNDA